MDFSNPVLAELDETAYGSSPSEASVKWRVAVADASYCTVLTALGSDGKFDDALYDEDTFIADTASGAHEKGNVNEFGTGSNKYYGNNLYTQNGEGVALKNAAGKVEFYAYYSTKADGSRDVDDAGNPIKIYGEIIQIDEANRVAPTLYKPGYANYTVKFTKPDGSGTITIKARVYDTEKKKVGRLRIDTAQLLFKTKAGAEQWCDLPSSLSSQTGTAVTSGIYSLNNSGEKVASSDAWYLVVDSTIENGLPFITKNVSTGDKYFLVNDGGTLTYRYTYLKTEAAGSDPATYEFGDALQIAHTTGTVNGISYHSKVYACGALTNEYKPESVNFAGYDGSVTPFTMQIPSWNLEGKHLYSQRTEWALFFKETGTAASHNVPGTALAICKCGKTFGSDADFQTALGTGSTAYNEALAQYQTTPGHASASALPTASKYEVPCTNDHTYQDASKPVTVAPTCKTKGFQFLACVVSDGKWSGGKYNLTLEEAKGTTCEFGWTASYDSGTDKTTWTIKANNSTSFSTVVATVTKTGDYHTADPDWHPVLVPGSVKEYVDHDFYTSSVAWQSDVSGTNTKDDDVTCIVTKTCATCGGTYTYKYHKKTAAELSETADLDIGSTDTKTLAANSYEVFGKIKLDIIPGEDCSKGSTLVYSIPGVTNATGKDVTKELESSVYFGPHTYKNTVTFSKNGESASVTQKCENITKGTCKGKKDANGNDPTQVKTAVVTPTENADGSTTYTATLEGVELKDNTKTVYDLSKATITINGGKAVDVNAYATTKALVDANLVEVIINGVAIDKNYWDYKGSGTTAGGTTQKIAIGNNTFELLGKDNSATSKVDTVNKNKVVFVAEQPPKMSIESVKIDGIETAESAFKDEFDYDGKDHSVVIAAKNAKDSSSVTDATVKYAVVYKDGSGVLRYEDDDERVATKKLTAATTGTGWVIGAAGVHPSWSTTAVGEVIDFSKLVYDTTDVELSEVGTYYVFAKFEKDGFTTWTAEDSDNVKDAMAAIPAKTANPTKVTINKSTKYEKILIIPSAQTITYGDTSFKFTTGDAQADEDLGLTTRIDVSKLSTGYYAFDSLFDMTNENYILNYGQSGYGSSRRNISWASDAELYVKQRNATVVIKGATVDYTGKKYVPEYTVDGVLEGDDLGIVLNTEEGKEMIEPGTYTVFATANNANYTIAKTTATVVIKANTEDQSKAEEAITAINKLNDSSREADVVAARKLYDGLTDTQKAIVSADTLAKLERIEAIIAAQTPEQKTAISKADAAVTNPTDKNIEAAQAAIDAAKKAGADTKVAEEALAKARTANAKDAVAAALQLANAAKSNPTAANIAAADKAITAANAKTQYMDAATKSSMTQATNALAAARKAAAAVKITFGNAKVKKALNKKGTKTSRIKVKKGKKLKLKAKSSNGAKITYKAGNKKVKVSKKGVITAVKAGKSYVLVTCGGKKVKVLLKITKK
jgi:hypothetical protein